MMLFDTHAHLDDRAFDADRETLLGSLPEQGLALVMNPGCSLVSSRAVDGLTRVYPWLYGAVGSHPDVAGEVDDAVLDEYRRIARENPKIRAVGEIGLDYYYDDVPRDVQKRAFAAQLELARELHLPVIVHDREAHGDAMDMVAAFPEVTGVFHCFSGSVEMGKWLVERGWYVGFTGVLTFKNARKAEEAAAALPLERLVLETDCPYLAPVPFRAKRNDPTKLHYTAEKLAEVRGMDVEEICRVTMENGKRLYGIGEL